MIVLDTNAWLWWAMEPERIPAKARALIDRAESDGGILVSAISVWEIATKVALGKLQLPLPVRDWYEAARQYPGVSVEPLTPFVAIDSADLPGEFHKDPADRIVVALARRKNATLVTADQKILDYPHVATCWE